MRAASPAAEHQRRLAQSLCRPTEPARLAAWEADLSRWVDELRLAYDTLWPEDEEAIDPRYTRKRPPHGWPKCWLHHRGLVDDLITLKVWDEALRDDDERAGDARGRLEWRSYVNETALYVRAISKQCWPQHRLMQLPPAPTHDYNGGNGHS